MNRSLTSLNLDESLTYWIDNVQELDDLIDQLADNDQPNIQVDEEKISIDESDQIEDPNGALDVQVCPICLMEIQDNQNSVFTACGVPKL